MPLHNLIKITLASAAALACCMLPATYKGSIGQSTQQGLIIYDHNTKTENLILQVAPKISGKEKLNNFCWLITVPNEPEKYQLVKADIFKELFRLTQKHLVIPPPPSKYKSSPDGTKSAAVEMPRIRGIELGKQVSVGAYDIQPVRGIGANALTGLNTWLKTNGFPTEPIEHMKYFVDNKFTFLAIKVNPAEQEKGIGQAPTLQPLQLTFKSDEIYYPMKYSSQQGDFSVNLFTLTSMPIDYKASSATLQRLTHSDRRLYKNIDINKTKIPKSLSKTLGTTTREHLYFNAFNCRQPNYKNAISTWKEDVFLMQNASHTPNSANQMKGYKGIPWGIIGISIAVIVLIIVGLKGIFKSKKE